VAVVEQKLGNVLREQNDPACVAAFTRAADLTRSIGNRHDEAICAYNLGRAYVGLADLRDLDRAEYWFRRSLDLHDEHDGLGRARATAQLGFVARQRFTDARAAGRPATELDGYLTASADAYRTALADLPDDAAIDLAIVHNQLGAIYTDAENFPAALRHYQRAIGYHEAAGNRFNAGQTRYNIAVLLGRTARPGDALHYVRAAERDFEVYGSSAQAFIDLAGGLRADLESAIAAARDQR
jgi:tetratricopeptide (TPR) repeat protein